MSLGHLFPDGNDAALPLNPEEHRADNGSVDETWVLIDQNTGLHVAWYFWLRVLDEVNRSQRYGEPFGLLLLRADAPSGRAARALEEAAAHVPAIVRGTDLAGTLGPGRVGILLTHQDEPSAARARDRIFDELGRRDARAASWEGWLLTYPQDAAAISTLLTAGWDGSPLAAPAVGQSA